MNEEDVLHTDAVWHTVISPAEDRMSMAHVELGICPPLPAFSLGTLLHDIRHVAGLVLPPNSSAVISIACEKAFMRQADFPPDVSRGLDLPAVAVTYQAVADSDSTPVRIYSESLLVLLPFPDFSMPFNVLTYVCTLVALFFGSLVNIVALRPLPKVFDITSFLYCNTTLIAR